MRRGSLQRRLAIRLALVYVLAIAMAVSFFIYQAYNTAGSLSDRQLGLRAADLVRYLSVANGGVPRLNLPPSWRPPMPLLRTPTCSLSARPMDGLSPPFRRVSPSRLPGGLPRPIAQAIFA